MLILGTVAFLAFIVLLILTVVYLFKNRKKAKKYAVWMGVSFVLFIIFAIIGGGNIEAKEQPQAAQSTMAEQQVEAPKPEAINIKVTALQLSKAYNANEVAADQKYKGKEMLVYGIITGIDKDFMNDIVVNLNSGNSFLPVRAHLEGGQDDKAASLAKGGEIIVQCSGGGFIIGSAVLNKCAIKKFANP